VSITGYDRKGVSLIGVYFAGFFDGRKGLVGDLVVGLLCLADLDSGLAVIHFSLS
jgi:hypothetical protein